VVAGLIASPSRWNTFEKEWRNVLARAQVPSFHSKEFFQRKNTSRSSKSPYRGWSDSEADTFISSLLTVVGMPRVWLLGAMIHVPDLMALTYGERCWLTSGEIDQRTGKWVSYGAPNVPYFVGFTGLIATAHAVGRRSTKLHFVFEERRSYGPYAKLAYERYKRDSASGQLGNLAFATRREAIPLQAADLVAHELYNANTRPRHTLNAEHTKILRALERKGGVVESCNATYFNRLLDRLLTSEARRSLQETADPTASA
jgi:hypothetical protein